MNHVKNAGQNIWNQMVLWLGLLLMLSLLPVVTAENEDTLSPLVELLGQTDDPQFQLDVLKGMSDGLKSRRGVKMPVGWEQVSAKLGKSSKPEVRELVQSL